jgi:hypothetical protein
MAGSDAIATGNSDGDGLCGGLAIGVRTVGLEKVVRAARIKGSIVIGESGWSTARNVVSKFSIFRIN